MKKRVFTTPALLRISDRMQVDGDGRPKGSIHVISDEQGSVMSVWLTKSGLDGEVRRLKNSETAHRVSSVAISDSPEISEIAEFVREIPTRSAYAMISRGERDLHLTPSWEF